jgi:hypothetical protein
MIYNWYERTTHLVSLIVMMGATALIDMVWMRLLQWPHLEPVFTETPWLGHKVRLVVCLGMMVCGEWAVEMAPWDSLHLYLSSESLLVPTGLFIHALSHASMVTPETAFHVTHDSRVI